VSKAPRDPFQVTLNKEQREKLALWLSQELDNGLNAKSTADAEVDYWHMLYEQARTRNSRNLPWPDAADLTSYLACEKVDALHARAMKTVWVEPVCTVEGWGQAADHAPFVEEFHQWKAEEERLQSVLDKLILISLIEPRGLLEVSEGSEWRTVRKRIQAQIQTDPTTGGMVYGEDGQPQPAMKPDGSYMETTDPLVPSAQILIDSTENQRIGPQYRIIPYRDSVILPGHAREKEEVWGYGKRLWKRHSEIVALSTGPRAIYDKDTVEQLTKTGDREPDNALERSNMAVAPQDETTAEKELWEVLVLIDLKAFFEVWSIDPPRGLTDGARWYLATVHKDQHLLLRWQYDDLEKSRFVPVILFPRPDRATEGFSFVGHKIITTVEEHTAYRNMAADRSSMANSVPILRTQGALWDPEEQPWGPKAVIDVRDPRELKPMEVPDVPASVFNHMQMCERTAERLAGVNDVASGQVSQETRTLGEIQMATEQSFVRMDLIIRRFQESLEDLYQIRHAIWKRVLAEQPDGIDAPQSLVVGLEGKGESIDQFMPDKKITAQLLDGAFRFKPHGSVETADTGKLRSDFIGAMQFLPQLLAAFPQLQMQFRGPQAGRAMAQQFVRLFRIPNPQAFIGSPAQDMQQALGAPGMPPGMVTGAVPVGAPTPFAPMGGVAGPPGPPGAPPMPGPPPGGMPPPMGGPPGLPPHP
jgi:hypothetical protein